MILNFDLTVFLTVYLVYGILLIFFMFLGISILRRKKSRLAITYACFYFVVAGAFVINIIYRTIDQHVSNIILNTATFAFGIFGVVFLLQFNQILYHSEKSYTLKKQVITGIIMFIIVSLMFVIMANGGVSFQYDISLDPNIEDLRQYSLTEIPPTVRDLGVPVWSPWFMIYGIMVSQGILGWVIVIARRLRKRMAAGEYAKKYTYNIIGIIMVDVVPLGVCISNTLNIPIVRTIYLILSILIVPAALLIYRGFRR